LFAEKLDGGRAGKQADSPAPEKPGKAAKDRRAQR
jgi:hypothetical protein